MRIYSHNYPSDITREQFALIQADLTPKKKRTKPREIELYDIFCAILYIIKGGIQWDMIPTNFPKKSIVRHYYDIWTKKRADETTILSEVLKKISNNSQKRRPSS